MNQVFKLLKLTITEKKRLVFSFVCTLFVALFTYMFVDLIQPIMDYMFRMAPEGIPERFQFEYRPDDKIFALDAACHNFRQGIVCFFIFIFYAVRRPECFQKIKE